MDQPKLILKDGEPKNVQNKKDYSFIKKFKN